MCKQAPSCWNHDAISRAVRLGQGSEEFLNQVERALEVVAPRVQELSVQSADAMYNKMHEVVESVARVYFKRESKQDSRPPDTTQALQDRIRDRKLLRDLKSVPIDPLPPLPLPSVLSTAF
eukprot:7727027-Pyramimonas_sp.AAC.1